MRYELTKVPTDRSTHEGTDSDSLRTRLAALRPDEHFQLWIYRDDGESACLFTNKEFAWLSVIHTDGDDILSIDPDYAGPPEAIERIYLENGQLDEMPRSHCIARESGIRAALHYFQTGARSSGIDWFPQDRRKA
jgi:hypothetical protein